MLKWLCLCLLIITFLQSYSQPKTIAEMKTAIENAGNSPLYVKDVLKKKFRLDTVIVTRTSNFTSLADSLAYRGVIKKVYGPYTMQGQKFLVQVLAKIPNTFYKISQIFIDTSVFRCRIADSLGKSIIAKVKNDPGTFGRLAQTYSMGGESATQGELGWVAKGSIIPAIDKQLAKSKKGDVFMIWSTSGLHIIRLNEAPKQDNGVALMMRVLL